MPFSYLGSNSVRLCASLTSTSATTHDQKLMVMSSYKEIGDALQVKCGNKDAKSYPLISMDQGRFWPMEMDMPMEGKCTSSIVKCP